MSESTALCPLCGGEGFTEDRRLDRELQWAHESRQTVQTLMAEAAASKLAIDRLERELAAEREAHRKLLRPSSTEIKGHTPEDRIAHWSALYWDVCDRWEAEEAKLDRELATEREAHARDIETLAEACHILWDYSAAFPFGRIADEAREFFGGGR